MKKIIWQLPTKQSNFSDYDYVPANAKFHAFINNKSLCGKHQQDDWFEQYDFNKTLKEFGEQGFCKICYKKYLKLLFENNCKRCKYFNKDENDCCYGTWNRPINEAIKKYLISDCCTFEGKSRFEVEENTN